jgi:hypothetical protein
VLIIIFLLLNILPLTVQSLEQTIPEYDEMTNKIGYWAREVIYYYIDNFQNPK